MGKFVLLLFQLFLNNVELIFSHSVDRFVEKRSDNTQCISDLGCFIGMRLIGSKEFPYSPVELNLKIKLYTRTNLDIPQIFDYTDAELLKTSAFVAGRPTKFIIHGFGGFCEKFWVLRMKRALLTKMDANIFCVDWKNGAVRPKYAKSAATTQLVAKMIAIFIRGINSTFGSILHRLHLIGFSLGAHISGNVGSDIPGISRITGLDPAGPVFNVLNLSKKLDKNDALFVDVIHTNGDKLLHGGLGYYEPSGHVDFYPNGGKQQLGCLGLILNTIQNVLDKIRKRPTSGSSCNHRRALEIFIESILEDCTMNGFPCAGGWAGFEAGDCFDVGRAIPIGLNAGDVQGGHQGSFYLTTRATTPLCGQQLKISIDVEDPSGQHSQFKGTVKLFFGKENSNNYETFIILQKFQVPKKSSKILTLDRNTSKDMVSIEYKQKGFWNIGSYNKEYLKVNYVEFTDGVSGESVKMAVEAPKWTIRSGQKYRLRKV